MYVAALKRGGTGDTDCRGLTDTGHDCDFLSGRLLKRELTARKLSANRLSLDIGVPSGRISHMHHTRRRSITADTAVTARSLFRHHSVSRPSGSRLAEGNASPTG